MGPVWEANHIWLILAVVIIFSAYPRFFQLISIRLHLPITILLIGIVFRGCSFTFRHYDVDSTSFNRTYSLVFFSSSIISVIFQGVILGALILGRFSESDISFYDFYIRPWLNPFCILVGLFMCCLDALLAAVFLSSEARDVPHLRTELTKRIRQLLLITVVTGFLVLLVGELSGISLGSRFINNKLSMLCLAVATLCIPIIIIAQSRLLVASLDSEVFYLWLARIGVAVLVGAVASGLLSLQFPVIVTSSLSYGDALTLTTDIAPVATQRALVFALLGGSLFIFPSLIYLFKVFKT
jgi:cytochrome bd ubiquinol oxidase subunit II